MTGDIINTKKHTTSLLSILRLFNLPLIVAPRITVAIVPNTARAFPEILDAIPVFPRFSIVTAIVILLQQTTFLTGRWDPSVTYLTLYATCLRDYRERIIYGERRGTPPFSDSGLCTGLYPRAILCDTTDHLIIFNVFLPYWSRTFESI